MLSALAPLTAGAAPASEHAAALARGDAAWARRSEGASGARAAAGPVAAAVAAYREALAARPDDLEAAWKLLRAYYFQGQFATATDAERQPIFAAGKEVGEAALERLAAPLGGWAGLAKQGPEKAGAALAGRAEAAPVVFWTAVNWGLWGESVGRLKAARQGVGGKMRDFARTLIALDPGYEEGGGHRLLGRLHAVAPKVPFFTGWVDRELAVAELRRAVALAPDDPFNLAYLAEALIDHQPAARSEAISLLEAVLALEAPPGREVEYARSRDEAGALLTRLGVE